MKKLGKNVAEKPPTAIKKKIIKVSTKNLQKTDIEELPWMIL